MDTAQIVINDHANEANDIIAWGDVNFPFISWPGGEFRGRGTTKDVEKVQADLLLDFNLRSLW